MTRAFRRNLRRSLGRVAGVAYYSFGILASVVAVGIESQWIQAFVVVVGITLSGVAYYFDSGRQYRKVTDQKLEPLLEDLIFPMLVEDYVELVGGPPDIRVNVMLLRRRDLIPLGERRKLWPWQKSLKVDYSYGDYGDFDENDLKWGVDEGVCGTAIEYNRMIWSDLQDVEVHEWDMTSEQLNATQHLGSVISIPIYVPEDESKSHPVGILNVDSEANLDETEFDRTIGKEFKKYTNYIGMLV